MLSDVRPSADAAAQAQLPLVGMHGFGMRDFGSERTGEGEAKFDRAREDFSNFEQLSTAPEKWVHRDTVAAKQRVGHMVEPGSRIMAEIQAEKWGKKVIGALHPQTQTYPSV